MSVYISHECLKFISNKFELVLIASKKAREVSLKDVKTLVDPFGDKNTVIALREIEREYRNKPVENR